MSSNAPDEYRYTYAAIVENVYDGDTITLSIDLGFDIVMRNRKMRLHGIDAPEVRGIERPDGVRTRNWLRSRLPPGTEVVIKSHRDKVGKFGRYLCRVFKNGVDLNAQMVELGLADVYGDGGTPMTEIR